MATETVNGARIHYQRLGAGDVPVVLVHGSWDSHDDWQGVVPGLAKSFDVVAYDRRGHSRSERPPGPATVHDHVDDLAELIERLGLKRAWVVGNSFGGSIALRLAAKHPALLRGVIAHEPPLMALIGGDPRLASLAEEENEVMAIVADSIAAGNHAGGAEQFIEHVLGPGGWTELSPEYRSTFIENAPTFLDEWRDPDNEAFESTSRQRERSFTEIHSDA